MAMLTADHYIADIERFRAVLKVAEQIARSGKIVTLGIKPDFASTGYGYIRQGERLDEIDGFEILSAERFTEKPDQETATDFFESGRYSWNSGMFIWHVDQLLHEFQRQRPEIYQQLKTIAEALDTPRESEVLNQVWPQITKISVDYAIMENAKDVAVIPVDIGWSDVGSWASLLEIITGEEQGNVIDADEDNYLGIDTHRTLVHSDGRLVVTIGLEDMIVVETDDAVLVCPRDRSQDVKQVVNQLRQEDRDDLL
jgi:mannose-1-phosphate guanylyltransferase